MTVLPDDVPKDILPKTTVCLAFIIGVTVASLLVTFFGWQKIFHFILISNKTLVPNLCQFDKVVSSLKCPTSTYRAIVSR